MTKEIVITKNPYYFSSYENYTPDELIKIANRMKEDNVSSFKVCDDYGSIGFEYYRLETEEESTIRIKREATEKEMNAKRREEYLLREAQALGFRLEKD